MRLKHPYLFPMLAFPSFDALSTYSCVTFKKKTVNNGNFEISLHILKLHQNLMKHCMKYIRQSSINVSVWRKTNHSHITFKNFKF